jgi:hypothetical protein
VASLVDNSIVLLGMSIDNKLEKLHENFEKVKKKMQSIILYWDRFKLSLPGRIAIAKTFLLAQIGHLGCILTPKCEQILTMQEMMDNFCKGSLKVAASRIYKSPEQGGLGLIKISEFISAIQTVWVKRAYSSTRDNWRGEIYNLAHGNPFTICASEITQSINPVIYDIANSYSKLNAAFSRRGRNFLKAYVLTIQFLNKATTVLNALAEFFLVNAIFMHLPN